MALLTYTEMAAGLAGMAGWPVQYRQLSKTYEFRSFTQDAVFLLAVAPLADLVDHHPGVYLHHYRLVTVALSTHHAGGITQRKINLAQRVDRIPRPAERL